MKVYGIALATVTAEIIGSILMILTFICIVKKAVELYKFTKKAKNPWNCTKKGNKSFSISNYKKVQENALLKKTFPH